jgi:CHAT domain-containing protein/Tfp pilus assembly protein PilF
MFGMKNWIKLWMISLLVMYLLLSGLPKSVLAQDHQAELAEARKLDNQAQILYEASRYDEALLLVKQVLIIYEKELDPEHTDFASVINFLAVLYKAKGDYAQAEPLYKRALAIREKVFGPEHPEVAESLNNLAELYRCKGDYMQAEPLLKRALAIREKVLGPEHPQVAISLNNLGGLYYGKGDYAYTEPLLKRALTILEKVLSPEHPDVASSLNNLAELYRRKGDYVQAGPLLKRALAIREKVLGPEHPDVAISLTSLGGLYQDKGDYVQAELSLKRALAIREKVLGPEHPDVASSLNNLAELYRRKGDYMQAEPLLKRALAIREKVLGPEHPQVAISLNNLGGLYHGKGDYVQAELSLKRALAIREKVFGSEHPEVAESLNNLAELYRRKGDYVQAEPLYKRALAIREKVFGAEHLDVAISLNNLAALYYNKGDYVQAEPLYKRTLVILEKVLGTERSEVANSLNNLAELYRRKGDYVQAEPLHKRALAIWEKVLSPEHPYVANSLNNLAQLYQGKGDYVQAELLLKRALAIREKVLGPEHPDVASSLNNLAQLYRRKGDNVQAEPLHKRALAIREKVFGAERLDVAISLNNLAGLYHSKGDYVQAEPLYKRTLTIMEKVLGIKHPDVADLLNNLAGLYYSKGDYAQALQFLARGAEIQEYNLNLILGTNSERQKQLYLNSFSSETDAIVSLHVCFALQDKQAAQLALTTILQRKGRVLDVQTDQFNLLRLHATPQTQQLLTEWKQTRSYLATLQISGTAKLSPAQQQVEVARLSAEVERLEDELSRNSEKFRTQTAPVTLEAVGQKIPANTALVEIFAYQPFNAKAKNDEEKWGKHRYVAYILRPDQAVPQWVELGDAELIDNNVEQLRVALKDPRSKDVQTIARNLDEQVMRPVRKLLGTTKQILLSPDGALNLIPFEVLINENGRYLIENYSLSYLTSGRDLLRMRQPANNPSASVVMANPLYDLTMASRARFVNDQGSSSEANGRSVDFTLNHYKPLPGTAQEAVALGKLLPKGTQVFLQEQATEAALKQVNHPRILHIATHGFFLANQGQALSVNKVGREIFAVLPPSSMPANRENPLLRSGLILAGVKQGQSGKDEDGVLTALEVSVLDLWGTKLVVLSACETGLGEVQNGVGVYGLRRALVLAGSETQVMSLWKVADGGTRDLMTAYYRRLQKGEGRTEALRQVQLSMLRGQLRAATAGKGGQQEDDDTLSGAPKDYRHPYYWASFIPSGDWRNMQGKQVYAR